MLKSTSTVCIIICHDHERLGHNLQMDYSAKFLLFHIQNWIIIYWIIEQKYYNNISSELLM